MRYIDENNIDKLIKLHETLSREKDKYIPAWNEVITHICPERINSSVYGDTSVRRTNAPDRKELFDKTAVQAKKIYDAYKSSVLTPPDSTWLYINTDNDELNKNKEVKIFCEKVRDGVKKNLDNSNFYEENNKVFYDNSAFGPGILYVERSNSGSSNLNFTAMDIFECNLDINAEGKFDTFTRETQKTARQIIEEFGEENVSNELKKKYDKDPDEYVSILHVVGPRDIYKGDKNSAKKTEKEKFFASVWIELDTKHRLKVSGYNKFPFAVAVMPRCAGDKYGSSICIDNMPSIKMANDMAKVITKNAQFMAEPPLAANMDAIESWEDLEKNGIRPGDVIPVKVGLNGRLNEQIAPILTVGAQFNIALDLFDREIESIKNAFANNQITLPGLTTEKTATEVHIRKLDQARVMAPEYSCYERYLSDLVEIDLDILYEIPGELPEIPEILRNSNANYRIQFVSQLTKSQKVLEIQAILEWIQTILQVSQIFPQALQIVDIDYVVTHIAEVTNVPAQAVRSTKEIKQIRDAIAKQQEEQRAVELAQQKAETMKNLGSAAKNAQGTALENPEGQVQ